MGEGHRLPEPLENRFPHRRRELPIPRVELSPARLSVSQWLATRALQSRVDGETPEEPVSVSDDILLRGRGNSQSNFSLIPEVRIEKISDVE